MNIRRGHISDLNNIVNIEKLVYKRPYWSKKMFKRILTDKSIDRLWAYGEDNLLLGFIIDLQCEDEINILNLAIDKFYQNRGYGSSMLSDYLNIVPENCTIFLEVNENNNKALNIYNKHFFQIINRRKSYYNDGSDAIIMKLVK